MKVLVNTPRQTRTAFRQSIADLLSISLERFADRIADVRATVSDLNGPRGGIDKECRVCVVIPGFEVITTSARHENIWGAVAKATERARRIVRTRIKRPMHLRSRRAQTKTMDFAVDA